MAKHKALTHIQGIGKKDVSMGEIVDVNPSDESTKELVRLGALVSVEPKAAKLPTAAEIAQAEADEALRIAAEAKARTEQQ